MKKTANYEAIKFSQRHRNLVYEEVIRALEKAADKKGVTRTEIANKLGYTKAYISQLLSGPGNWTLDTVSNLLFAIDAEMQCHAVFFDERAQANHSHPAGELPETKSETAMPKPKRATTGSDNIIAFRGGKKQRMTAKKQIANKGTREKVD